MSEESFKVPNLKTCRITTIAIACWLLTTFDRYGDYPTPCCREE